jgi:HlyD family secretion protein
MNRKKIIAYLIVIILVVDFGVFVNYLFNSSANAATSISQTAAVKSVDSSIIVDGSITAQNEATLHFQTAGKLAYLPVKEGDKVSEGETIAQLDTYPLQQALSATLNSYLSARDQFDQSQINSNNNVTQNTTRGEDNFYGAGLAGGGDPATTNYLNDLAKRIVDENQNNLNNSVIAVQVANYALQMATLTSPLNGIVTHEDVNVAGQNVTTSTGFTVSDPSSKVFRANVPASDIDFISVGMNASVILDGVQNRINGTIVQIYPQKITLADGEDVYQVDIQSDDITKTGKLDQTGSAIIMTNAQNVMLIPAWTVLSGRYVWVDNNGKPQLRTVTVGKIHGDEIEITGGLSKSDRVITDPKAIAQLKYQIL